MDFTNFVVFSVEVPTILNPVVIGSAIAGRAVGAKEVSIVERTVVVTVGMTSIEVVANSIYLD